MHGSLARYVKVLVAHAPGMQGTFTLPPLGSNPRIHHDTCVTHVPWCMPRSLLSGVLWIRWRGKRSRHPRRMRNAQFYVYGKRSILTCGIFCLQYHHHKDQQRRHSDGTLHGSPKATTLLGDDGFLQIRLIARQIDLRQKSVVNTRVHFIDPDCLNKSYAYI